MKFYRYPLAVIAYALIGIYLFALGYHKLGGKTMDDYWWFFPAIAGAYLVVTFVLSLLKLHWELDVLLQVVCVLGPVLWFVNQRKPYKRPEYIFVVKPGYTGRLDIYFSQADDVKTNVRSTADTLYFRFDDRGEIQLNEEVTYVERSISKNLFYLNTDRSREHIPFADTLNLPADTTQPVLVRLAPGMKEGRVNVLHYKVGYPHQLK